jgi:phospholipid-binding lipoprotein MlaA
MSTEKIVDEGSVDRYDFIKNSYQQNREYLVSDGNLPDENDPDLIDETLEDAIDPGKVTETMNSTSADKSNNNTKGAGAPNSQTTDKKPGHFLELTAPQ